MLARDAEKNFDDAVRISAIGNAHRYADPARSVGKRPINNFCSDELAIGDNDVGAVRRAQYAGAKADLRHFSEDRPDLDLIADLERVLENQNKAGDKVVHYVL